MCISGLSRSWALWCSLWVMTLLCSLWQLMIKRVTWLIYAATCLYKGRDDQLCYSTKGCRLTEALRASLCRLQQHTCPHCWCSSQMKNSLLLPENRKNDFFFLLLSLSLSVSLSPAFHKLKTVHNRMYWCVVFFLPAAHAKQVKCES